MAKQLYNCKIPLDVELNISEEEGEYADFRPVITISHPDLGFGMSDKKRSFYSLDQAQTYALSDEGEAVMLLEAIKDLVNV